MSDDRKYKQRGYNDDDRPSRGRGPSDSGLPRTRVITTYKETVRCDECGNDLSTEFDVGQGSRCPKCSADLHTCRNCLNFDTSALFQCAQPIKKRVTVKSKANDCTFFTARTISVKDLGPTTAAPRTDDAMKALKDLFKK